MPLSAKPRRTQAERSEAMRARLAAAAFDTIAEGGFTALRMRNVAQTAGVSQGALMHHFPDKNALILAAVEQALMLAREDSAGGDDLSTDASPEAVLRALLADLRTFFFSDRFWVAIGITMEAAKDAAFYPQVRKAVSHLRMPVYTGWEDRLEAAGWSRNAACAAVRSAAAMISGFAVRRFWAEPDDVEDALTQEWVQDRLARL